MSYRPASADKIGCGCALVAGVMLSFLFVISWVGDCAPDVGCIETEDWMLPGFAAIAAASVAIFLLVRGLSSRDN